METTSTTGEVCSYLSFKLNDEHFAIPVTDILEILEVPKITKIPNAPTFMRGVINFRNLALPVVDTKEKFDIGTTEFTINTCIIVLSIKGQQKSFSAGILVDAVMEVFDVDSSKIQDSYEIGDNAEQKCIKGMLREGDRFAMILDTNKLFNAGELGTMIEKSQLQTQEAFA